MSLRSWGALIGLCFLSACGPSEDLDADELEFVNISVALGKVKATAKDSADHQRLRDSVLRAFGTTNEAYLRRTNAMTDKPDRTSMIFRAIGDSLGIR